MRCNSVRAERSVLTKLQHLCSRCELFAQTYQEKDSIYNEWQQFEQKRGVIHKLVLDDVTDRILDDLRRIQALSNRLLDMKNYCTMRAAADKEYSKKLMELSGAGDNCHTIWENSRRLGLTRFDSKQPSRDACDDTTVTETSSTSDNPGLFGITD